MLSQKEIAKKVGVSQKTVSKYFKDTALVSKDTGSKIADLLKGTGYFRNQAALAMRDNRFYRIACIVVQAGRDRQMRQPHLMTYLNGMCSTLTPAGYSLVFEPVYIDYDTMKVDFPLFFSSISVDGIIGVPGNWIPPEIDERLTQMSLPVVWLNRQPEIAGPPCINFDEFSGTYELARQLILKKPQKVFWFGPDISGNIPQHYTVKERCEMLSKIFSEAGIEFKICLSLRGVPLAKAARQLYHHMENSFAVCYNYSFSVAWRNAALYHGAHPEQLCITHYVSSWELGSVSPESEPFLELPEAELGARAAEYLLSLIDRNPRADLLIPLKLKLHLPETSTRRKT